MKNKNYPYYDVPFVNDMKELLDYCAENYGNKTAFWHGKGDKEIHHSYIDVRNDVALFATYLHSVGFAGKHIAILGENSYEWIVAYFAVVNMGGVVVPIDKELDVESITALLKRADVDLLIHSKAYTEEAAATGFKTLSLNDTEEFISSGKNLITEGDSVYSDYSVDKETMCAIVFTSGTTGEPKGVMLSHKSLCSSAYGAAKNISVSGNSILILPLYHLFGFTAGVLSEFYYGFGIYICNNSRRIIEDCQTAKPQHFFAVPVMLENFLDRLNNPDNQSDTKLLATKECLDLIISGGAPLPEQLITSFSSIGITVLNGYGITECSPIIATNRNLAYKKNSVGLPICTNTVSIINKQVAVKGANVMLGYYKNNDATTAAFDSDWFKTGDLGFIDEDGFLFLTGRVNNLIVLSSGKNVSPEELEALISNVDGVQEVVVYGNGNCITAEIFPQNGNMNLQEEIKKSVNMLNENLPMYKRITSILFRNTEFEKTATKKIKRQ